MIDNILCKVFPPYRFNITRKGQDVLLRSIIDSLPNDYKNLKSQIQSLTFYGLSDWLSIPDYKFITIAYPGETIHEYKKWGQSFKISGIEIFSTITQNFESVEILIKDNLLSGIKISNSSYLLNEFDLQKIRSENAVKSNFDFPPTEIDLFYDSLNNKIKSILNPDDFFDIDYSNKTFYAFYDLADGNYLAVDKNQIVYSLIHDAKPAVTRIKYSFEEILIEIREGRFDKERHVYNRIRKIE